MPFTEVGFGHLSLVFLQVLACLVIVHLDVLFQVLQLLKELCLRILEVVHSMIFLANVQVIALFF